MFDELVIGRNRFIVAAQLVKHCTPIEERMADVPANLTFIGVAKPADHVIINRVRFIVAVQFRKCGALLESAAAICFRISRSLVSLKGFIRSSYMAMASS